MKPVDPPSLNWEEYYENLKKDGGRKVLDGGDAYEDDLEPAGDGEESRAA
jgi:hypothetical protein